MKARCHLLLLFLGIFMSPDGRAEPFALDLTQLNGSVPLGQYFEVLEDPKVELDLAAVLGPEAGWTASGHDVPNYGFTNHAYWFRTEVRNPLPDIKSYILSVEYAGLKKVSVTILQNNQIVSTTSIGDEPFAKRPIQTRGFAFPIQFKPGASQLLIHVYSPYQTVQVPIFIRDAPDFYVQTEVSSKLEAIFFGIIVAMAIYNLFLYFEIRKSDYLYYVFFVLTNLLFQLALNGYGFQHFWPDSPRWQSIASIVLVPTIVVFANRFFIGFFEIKRQGKDALYFYVLVTNIVLAAMAAIVPLIYPHPIASIVSVVIAILDSGFVLGVVIKEWTNGYSPAKYFTIAWAVFLMGTIIRALQKMGLLPFNMFTESIQQFGAVIEGLLLSFSLGDKISFEMRKDRKRIDDLNVELQKYIGKVEVRVEEQTRQIASIMAHIEQGIFTILPGLIIDEHYSQHLQHILDQADIAGKNPFDLFLGQCNLSSDELDRIKSSLVASLGESSLNFLVNAGQLPQEVRYRGRILEVNWQQIVDKQDQTERILVAIRDVTELRAMEEQRQHHRDELQIISELISVSESHALSFFEQSRKMLDEVRGINEIKPIFMRLHTLKGIARGLQFRTLTSCIHDAESYCAQVMKAEVAWDSSRLQAEITVIDSVLDNYIKISEQRLGRRPGRQVASFVGSEDLLAQLGSQARILAKDLKRAEPLIRIEGPNVDLPMASAHLLTQVLTHLLRNSLDHGIETGEERMRLGKDPQGTIRIAVGTNERELVIEFGDDGAGMRLPRLHEMGVERGLISAEERDPQKIAALIFEAGLSTARTISDISGRGVGMSAVRDLLERAGGRLEILFQDPSPAFDRPAAFVFRMTLPMMMSENSQQIRAS